MKRKFIFTFMVTCLTVVNAADKFVSFTKASSVFAVAKDGKVVDVVYDNNDYAGVRIALNNLQNDIKSVCGVAPAMSHQPSGECMIVGSMQSALIQQLVKTGKIQKKELEGKNEKYLLQVIDQPMAGVNRALVIAGSDKRGTIYGIYELSRQMGVSPWYWFMDVPVQQHQSIFINKGVYTDGEPKVAYRGIFINDEWPSFGNWVKEKFGGINSKCYEKIFELVLRMKGNYMWPAMWGSAFYDDDKENGPMADRMGIVMGTSHHEPLALAQQDWHRRPGHGA